MLVHVRHQLFEKMNNCQHKEIHLKKSDFIEDVIIGMSEGLTIFFAFAAELSSVAAGNTTVTTTGIAEIIAGFIAMG